VCMYCGALLPVTRIEAAPRQRQLDNADHAFNTVIDPSRSRVNNQSESALASALQIEEGEARAFIGAGKPVPVARCSTRQEAELIAALLRTCGVGASVVADDDLKLEKDLIRARRIVRNQDLLEIHHSGGHVAIAVSAIRLLVVGALRSSRIDFTEGISRSRGNSGSLLDTSEFRSDEMLVDVYGPDLEQSFRIKSDGFDYSGLVRPMSFRAEVNFQTALTVLQEAAHRAKTDDDFARIRGLLSRAWPERSRVETRGVKRAGLAFRPVAQGSVISDNRNQFERYSRLMFVTLG
jgi:hypothetical protein